jgi:hypothetical protein
MSLSPKTITVFLDATVSGKKRATHAAALAQRWGAHLVGVNVMLEQVPLPVSMSFARGDQAFREVAAYRHQLDSEAEATVAAVNEDFRALCAALNVSAEFRRIGRDIGHGAPSLPRSL